MAISTANQDLTGPVALFDHLLAQQKIAYDATLKMWSRLFAIPKAIEWAQEVAVGTTPHEVVYEEGSLSLLRYRRDTPAKHAEPIMFCYALVNRPYIVDLQPQRSVVRQLLDGGFDVYLIDWGVPSAADRSMTLHDYIDGIMKNCADVIIRNATTPNLHLIGYCMGGTMSAIFAARYPELTKTLTLMTAPIDFSVGSEDSLVQFWSNPDYFDVDALIDAFGNCPAPVLQHSFQMMKPVQTYFTKYTTFFEKMDDEGFLENYFAMEKWTNDNIPVAGETFREFVKKFYQGNELVRGEFRMTLGEEPVKLNRITCPLMLLMASADHLVPPAQTEGIRPHVGSTDIKSMTLQAGHIGLAVSNKAHKKFWPEATQWLADRSTPKSQV
jgi:polyhydroxyalkanoate synthase